MPSVMALAMLRALVSDTLATCAPPWTDNRTGCKAGIELPAKVLRILGLDCRHRGVKPLALQISHLTPVLSIPANGDWL
jgi:hypothetical protein